MATKPIVIDDLDGSNGASTIEFAFDGVQYSIDLSRKNKAAFSKAVKIHLEAARTAPGRSGNGRGSSRARKRSAGRGARAASPDLAAVRAWAAENEYEGTARGRVAQGFIDVYEAAQH